MTATVQHRQSVLDLAIQHLGSVEACFTVAERLGISITDLPEHGLTFDFSEHEIIDKKVTAYYASNGIVPVTDNMEAAGIFDETFDLTFN